MSHTNYILTSDGNFVSEDELYHYGVIGMKWGKRKADYYTAQANKYTSKMRSSKTRLGKDINNYKAYVNEAKANIKKTMGEKGIGKTIDNVYGHGGYASQQKAAANYYDRKSTYTKTRLGTTMAKSNAYNMNSNAKANQRIHNAKGIKKASAYVNAAFNMPIKTWSGRTTTTGKNAIDTMFGIGTIKDISYYMKNKN